MAYLCECGCEQEPKSGNRYVYNHHSRGLKRSVETKHKQSQSSYRRYEDPTERAKTSNALKSSANSGRRLILPLQLCKCGCGEKVGPRASEGKGFRRGHATLGMIQSNKTRTKHSENRIRYLAEHNGPWKDIKPELELERRLRGQGIGYEKQRRIGNMLVDFYLPQQNLVVEVDGCWWHGCLDCHPTVLNIDKFEERQQRLTALGYDSIRIWEHELQFSGSF